MRNYKKDIINKVKGYFKRKPTTKKQRRANATNINSGIDNLRDIKSQRARQMDAVNKELGIKRRKY